MRLIDLDSEYIQETLYRRSFKTRQDIEEWLNNAPIIDAVPVVRCRECKWWQEDDDIGHCDNPDGLDNYAKPEDFCSYGERKGGAE